MNTSLQNHESASEIVEAGVYFGLQGKTMTAKRIEAVQGTNHYGVSMYAMSSKSKAVREAAAPAIAAESIAAIVRAKMSGNWKPVAGLFAFILGEAIRFGMGTNNEVLTGPALRARLERDWRRLGDRIDDTLETTEKLTKAGKVSPKYAKWDEARQAFEAIELAERVEMERREEARKERELAALRNA